MAWVGFVLLMKGCISHSKSRLPSAAPEGNEKAGEGLGWEKLSTLSRFLGELAGFSRPGSPVACAFVSVLEWSGERVSLVVVPSELQ